MSTLRKFSFLLLLLFPYFTCLGNDDIELINTLKTYRINTSSESEKLSFLKNFIGDTIKLNFYTSKPTDLFSKQYPDTIWIKKRPKKNPEKGKHYKLSYAYKGIPVGDEYQT